jgi:hypothetical protein
MLRRSFTAVIEKNTTWSSNFDTEPYETGWASEARWFIRIVSVKGNGAGLAVTPQISPDGLFWCDEGHTPLVLSKPGQYSFALRDFGHWLRLKAEVLGTDSAIKVMMYLALKE